MLQRSLCKGHKSNMLLLDRAAQIRGQGKPILKERQYQYQTLLYRIILIFQ
jgi:hypothetical protein